MCFLITIINVPHVLGSASSRDSLREPELIKPTVVIALLVRNKGHVLPYSLQYLQSLDYPQDRIVLW